MSTAAGRAKAEDARVLDNADESRYELWLGDTLAGTIEYAIDVGRIVLIHTEVEEAFKRRGLGSRLVAAALADIRSRGLKMVPACPFVRLYVREHATQRDLLDGEPAPDD
ncbi:MAG TPA: GNAT family N-acetyltransferase [Actinomycetota bacterium]|nr:GNAT family N-acetyltransferase [Actinomycetota bacterium]